MRVVAMRIGPRFAWSLIIVSLAVIASADIASAQQTSTGESSCVSATGPDSGSVAPRAATIVSRDTTHATLRIFATASAAELRFVGSPKICVKLTGDAQLDSVRVVGRRNLASPVVSNTTYKDVYIAVEIVGRLNADCIASRITGAGRDSTSTAACASLGTVTPPPQKASPP